MGDTFLLLLTHSALKEYADAPIYMNPMFAQGFFYVTEDEKVYPADHGEKCAKYTGMPLGEFTRVVQKHGQWVPPLWVQNSSATDDE